jgi:hypothetical protein
MLCFYRSIIRPQRDALGISNGLLKFSREFVKTHDLAPLISVIFMFITWG